MKTYLKSDFTVPCPEKAVYQKRGAKEYVYVNLEKFKKEGKKGYQYIRKLVGETRDRKVMRPNDNYFSYFHVPRPAPDQSTTLIVGVPVVIEYAAKSSGLLELLEDFFGNKNARRILDLAMFTLLCRTDAFQHYTAFAFLTALLSGKTMSDSTISRFLSNVLKPSVTSAFTKEWARLNSKGVTAYIYLDSTSVNTEAEGIEIAELGFAKDDPTIPQVNFEVVIRQNDGLPLFYKVYPGSLVDVNQLEDLVKMFKELGFENIVVVADRGYVSRKNIKALDEQGIDFLFLLKECTRTEELIEKYGRKIARKAECYLPERDVYAMTVRHRLFDNMGPVRSLHIVWTPKMQEEQTKKLLTKKLPDMAIKLEKAVQSKERWHGTTLKNYRKYFDIETDEENHILSFEKNNKLINKQIEMLGFKVFASSIPMEAQEAIEIYAGRDSIEKVFKGLKSFSGMDVLRGHSEENVESRFFIYFIDAILRSLIMHLTLKMKKKNRKDYTFQAIMDELVKIQAQVDEGSDIYYRLFRLTKHQKNILDCLNIDEKIIDDFIRRVLTVEKILQEKQAR